MPPLVNNSGALSHVWVQHWRLLSRGGFFLLFLLAPALNIFRLDLDAGGFILFGQELSLGLSGFFKGGAVDPLTAGMSVLTHAILPVLGFIALVVLISWRYGRLYCSWLCPHFSVVEIINGLMLKARGKPTLWEPATIFADWRYWSVVIVVSLLLAFVWAVSLLTYLLPPEKIFYNLTHAQLTPNQMRFIAVGTLLLFIDFVFARHLFCRFGCAAGMFQSLVWMGNRQALTPLFERERAVVCQGCPQSCDTVCPMRLKPRGGKNKIASCTQCGLCLQACDQERGEAAPLRWQQGKEIDGHSGGYTQLPPSVDKRK